MSRRPGRVKLSVDVKASKPRNYDFLSSPEFSMLQRELVIAVQNEVESDELHMEH